MFRPRTGAYNFEKGSVADFKVRHRKKKPPDSGSGGFWTCFAAGPSIMRRPYALVRAESTPLASEPMLLPSAL